VGGAFSVAHADNPASPLLSAALLTARDGVTGYWNGSVTAVPDDAEGLASLNLPKGAKYLDDLRPSYQAYVLETLINSAFGFQALKEKGGRRSGVKLKFLGKTLTKLRRPSQEHFKEQLDWLRAYADLRDDRLAEIQLQLNDMMSFFGAQNYLDDGRRKYTLMLLNIVRNVSINLETPFKYYCRAARPIDYAPQVQPMIQTPNHSSFPSGHAVESFAVAAVLYRLKTGKSSEYGISGSHDAAGVDRDVSDIAFRFAHRMATNRTVAGVHFPVDSVAGAYVGCMIAEAIYALASGTPVRRRSMDLDCADPKADFLLKDFNVLEGWNPEIQTAQRVKSIPGLRKIWKRAADEWPMHRGIQNCEDGVEDGGHG
jgi:hypothetical protein